MVSTCGIDLPQALIDASVRVSVCVCAHICTCVCVGIGTASGGLEAGNVLGGLSLS